MNFTERLSKLQVINWKAAGIETQPPPQLALVRGAFILCEGESKGVLDGVTAALFLQGVESTRLLVALNDHLIDLATGMTKGDPEAAVRAMSIFVADLPKILTATSAASRG